MNILVTNILLLNPNISLSGRKSMEKVGRHGEKYQNRELVTRMLITVCVAIPQYAMPLNAIVTPIIPEIVRPHICAMDFCFTINFLTRTALWAVAVLDIKNPKKRNLANGVSSGL